MAVCYTLTLSAQNKPAMIKSRDGIANLRSGPGKDFPVVDTIYTNEFFYCKPGDTAEWIKVSAYKGRQTEGFIHKSNIQLIEKLSHHKQQMLLTQILKTQKLLAYNFDKAWRRKDTAEYRKNVKILERHSDAKYSPVLDILPAYFCSTNDTLLLQLFFATIWADDGSANEVPSFALGSCFACKPDLFLQQLAYIKNKAHKKLLLDDVKWGLLNNFSVDESEKSDNREFNILNKRINAEIKKTKHHSKSTN